MAVQLTYRLRQLPPRIGSREVLELLSKGLNVDSSTIEVCSLARNVDKWTVSQVATIIFDKSIKITDVLDDKDRPNVIKMGDEWKIQVENLREPLILDSHFRGLTPLYDPGYHVADCIAISGLASHPFGSWQPKGASKHFMWLRDAFPPSLPNVRPILYGYDTTLLKDNSFQSIFDLAIGLLDQLKANGWTSPKTKPLSFLAHSLGGLVLKQAFVSLANKIEHDDPLRNAIKGAVLFGVPNLGMEQSHLAKAVEGQANSSLIADLAPNSPYLVQLDEQFSGITFLRHTRLYWGYETRESPTLMQGEDGKWSRTGLDQVLVTPLSATRGLYTPDLLSDSIFPINGDHSSLVKFQENDPNLAVVVQKLRQVYGKEDCGTGHPSGSDSDQASLPWDNIVHHSVRDTNEKTTHPHKGHTPGFKTILESLEAPERDRRLEEIETRFHHTFDWIYDRPEPEFTDWLQTGTGLFWINGKPGSGKSTLMKFIFQDRRTSDLLYNWKSHSATIHAAFFFHYRGTPLQKSFEGLLRSILVQLIQQNQAFCHYLYDMFEWHPNLDKSSEGFWTADWSIENLQKGFNSIMQQVDIPLHLCLFLDALDEYDGRLEFISGFLKTLQDLLPTPTRSIKVCFSSRPWDIFMTHFQHCSGFSIQDFTQEDIRDYCLGSIKEERITAMSLEELIPDLVERSRGVFLWVKLVVKDLADASRRTNMNRENLERLLKALPTELDEYYAEIIQRIPRALRWKTYAMLEVATRSESSLTPEQFIGAVRCAGSSDFEQCMTILQEIPVPGGPVRLADLVKRESRIHCGGLVDVAGEFPRSYVQVLHQTVEDFVANPRFKQLVLEDRAKITVENGNSFLVKYCTVAYVQTGHNGAAMKYAYLAEQTTGRSMRTFLESVPNEILSTLAGRGVTIRSCLGVAVTVGLRLYVIESLAANANLFRDSGENLLSYVMNNVNLSIAEEMVQLLLELGFESSRDSGIWTSLTIALQIIGDDQEDSSRATHLNVVQNLLSHGASPDEPIDSGGQFQRPLHCGRLELTRLLLNNGADVNGHDSEGCTPLDTKFLALVNAPEDTPSGRAKLRQSYRVVCLLLENGGNLHKVSKRSAEAVLARFSQADLPTDALRERLWSTSTPSSSTLSLRHNLKASMKNIFSR